MEQMFNRLVQKYGDRIVSDEISLPPIQRRVGMQLGKQNWLVSRLWKYPVMSW